MNTRSITITSERGRDGQIRSTVEDRLALMSDDDRRIMLESILRHTYDVAHKYRLTLLSPRNQEPAGRQ